MAIRKLALDPGFGGFKVAEVNGDAIYTNTVPSVVGLGQIKDMGLLSAGIRRKHQGQDKPIQIDTAGQSYLVGRNVHDHARPNTRLDFQRLADGPEMRALVFTALASRMNGGPYGCSLIVGMPVEIMQDRSQAQRTLYALRAWLVGQHRFRMNGSDYEIEVDKIKMAMQPLGTYFAFGMGPDGKWRDDRVEWEAPAAVVDIGFNTVDIFGIRSGQLISRYTAGNTLGMHRAARAIIEQIRSRYRVELSMPEADGMIRLWVEGKPVDFYHSAGKADLAGLVEAALSQTFSDLNEFLAEHLERGTGFRYLLITGGGAEALKRWLVEQYPHAVILNDPVTANANGLARFAVRPGVLE